VYNARRLLNAAFFGLSVGALTAFFSQKATAQSCSTTSFPYTLTSGSTAVASQVMADLNCAPIYGLANWGGNIGIGTQTPSTTLQVNGAITATLNKAFQAPPTGAVIDVVGANGAITRTVLDGYLNGNIGAAPNLVYRTAEGTGASPSALQSGDLIGLLSWFGYGASGYSPSARAQIRGVATQTWTDTAQGVAIPFFVTANNTTSIAEAMRIDNTGYVGIGTTSPPYPLYVNGQAGGTTAWAQASDGRLKTDISSISGAINLIERLRGVRYRWLPKAQRTIGKNLDLPVNRPQIGFVAQEVERVVPEAVNKPDRGPDSFYTVQETSLIPILVEAVKAQEAEIRELRAIVSKGHPKRKRYARKI
jgi:hypothetical protein